MLVYVIVPVPFSSLRIGDKFYIVDDFTSDTSESLQMYTKISLTEYIDNEYHRYLVGEGEEEEISQGTKVLTSKKEVK